MKTVMYGIPNCDTIKKARRWCDEHGVDYRFHDFRKHGFDKTMLDRFEKAVSWEVLLNRRGMLWRKLPQSVRDNIDRQSAHELMLQNPAIIKRPVLEVDGRIEVGFDTDVYTELLT